MIAPQEYSTFLLWVSHLSLVWPTPYVNSIQFHTSLIIRHDGFPIDNESKKVK
jgi:hypothetical protein